jgi:hypothetical protein
LLKQGTDPPEVRLELDESLAEPYVSRAMLKTIYDWDWAGTEKDFRRGIELSFAKPLTWIPDSLNPISI